MSEDPSDPSWGVEPEPMPPSLGAPDVGVLRIVLDEFRSHPLVRLQGDLDMSQEAAVRETLLAAEGHGTGRVIVDLRGLSFIDSTGLRLCVEADARARKGGWDLVLVKPREELYKIFRMALLDERLDLVDDLPED